ncbi:MAG: PAS domain S-box protein [Flavobacteriia bacterium]|nr:PAS domain S-box protein [Flavobacteriia bacterium]
MKPSSNIDWSYFDHLEEGVQIISFEFEYLYVNQVAAGHGMTTAEKLLGRTMQEAYPGIKETSFFDKIKRCLELKESFHFTNPFDLPDGTQGHFDIKITPVELGAMIVSVDVTASVERELEYLQDKKNLLANLDYRETKYRYILNHSNDSIVLLDKDKHVVFANKNMEKYLNTLFGKEVKEGGFFEDFVHPAALENFREAHRLALDKEDYHVEKRLSTQQFTMWFEFNTAPVLSQDDEFLWMMLVAKDITERKEIENALRLSEAKFRAMVESSQVGVIIIRDDRFVYSNSSFRELFGYEWTDMDGLRFSELFNFTTEESHEIHEHLEDDDVSFSRRAFTAKGEEIWVEAKGTSVLLEEGLSLIYTMNDITAKKRAEDQLMHVNAQLVERVKELSLISKAADLIRKPGELYRKLHTLVNYFPEAWQFPTITTARIRISELEWLSDDFEIGPYQLPFHFQLFDGSEGSIEVFYKQSDRVNADDPFLEEERSLIKVIAEMIEVEYSEKWNMQKVAISEANLSTIFNNTSSAYVLIDTNLNVISFNSAAVDFAEQELGVKSGVALTVDRFLDNSRFKDVMAYIQRAMKGETLFYDVAYPQSDDLDHWYSIKMVPVSSGGNVLHVIISIDNITERKRSELQAKKQLQLFKELSFITSHELRHDYAKIEGLIDLLTNIDQIDDELRELLKESRSIFTAMDASISKLNDKISFTSKSIYREEGDKFSVEHLFIVDDDPMVMKIHSFLAERTLPSLKIHSYLDAKKALAKLEELNTSKVLVLLDLNMPIMNGWGFLDALKARDIHVPVFIVTSSISAEDQNQTREYDMVKDFIAKPITREHLRALGERIE